MLAENRSQFVIEPLEPGFGYTLGNSLRRTLLSSIPGAAVTSIRIDGVLHEFTTVPGVKEDVTDIILNLKGLVVSSEEDEPVTMYLRKQGPGTVTAGDIVPPAGVTVHNPDMHIATLNDKGKLEVELVVERGRGYVPAVQNKASGAEIGRIPVDSIYSPVLKVTYKVEATRVEQRTDFDKLILDVETKNSISPRDALASDGKTLVVYQSPVKMLADEFQVQPTRLAFYDAETGELRSTAEVPRQITLVAWSEDGSRIYGMGRKMYVFDATGKQIEEKPIHGWQTETYAQPDVLDVWSQFEQSGVITTPFYTVRLDLPADDPTIYRTGILTQDLETGEMKMQEVEPTDIFYFSTAASPTDKNRIFGAYNFLSSFDMAEGKPLKRVPLPHSYYSVNVSSDGKTVYLGGAMSDVSAYDAETLEKKGEVQMPDGAAISLASIRMFQRQD